MSPKPAACGGLRGQYIEKYEAEKLFPEYIERNNDMISILPSEPKVNPWLFAHSFRVYIPAFYVRKSVRRHGNHGSVKTLDGAGLGIQIDGVVQHD